ncbi:MAG: DUF5615 family PIN-like protein [Candidatus Nanoarchaeia archaeon]
MEAKEILDTSIAIGRKEGAISIFTIIEHPPSGRKNFEIIIPEGMDYTKAIEIAWELREKGTPGGAIDILIAAMCLNRKCAVVTKDKDFEDIQAVYPELEIKS